MSCKRPKGIIPTNRGESRWMSYRQRASGEILPQTWRNMQLSWMLLQRNPLLRFEPIKVLFSEVDDLQSKLACAARWDALHGSTIDPTPPPIQSLLHVQRLGVLHSSMELGRTGDGRGWRGGINCSCAYHVRDEGLCHSTACQNHSRIIKGFDTQTTFGWLLLAYLEAHINYATWGSPFARRQSLGFNLHMTISRRKRNDGLGRPDHRPIWSTSHDCPAHACQNTFRMIALHLHACQNTWQASIETGQS